VGEEIVLGLLAVIVGVVFCFRGYLTMRLVIPLWGALAGFLLGAGLVASVTGDGLLGGLASWAGGVVLGLLFALIAYTYYEVSVVLAMGAIGFALGTSLMVALGVSWNWLIVLTGVAVAVLLAVIALMGELPMVLLTVLTATAGASAVVAGLLLLTGGLETSELGTTALTDQLQEAPGWWVLYAVLALAGIVAQLRALASLRGSLREQWMADGGRQLRTT
jgi:hypothetical protein